MRRLRLQDRKQEEILSIDILLYRQVAKLKRSKKLICPTIRVLHGKRGITPSLATLSIVYAYPCFLISIMSTNYIHIGTLNDNSQDHSKHVTLNVPAGTDVSSLIKSIFTDEAKHKPETEDVEPVDTSFFGTDRYSADVCEKNLREAIDLASGKADACRRIMLADACGYIHIRQFSDARKAELINPFAQPKYTFTYSDFTKARNRTNKK